MVFGPETQHTPYARKPSLKCTNQPGPGRPIFSLTCCLRYAMIIPHFVATSLLSCVAFSIITPRAEPACSMGSVMLMGTSDIPLQAYLFLRKLPAMLLKTMNYGAFHYTLCGNTPAGGGLLTMLLRLFRLFFIWLFSALESRGLRSSKLHRSSVDTLMTAP